MTMKETPNGFDALTELALDLHWSWDHGTDEIWQQLDPALWNLPVSPMLFCERCRAT